MHDSTAAIKDAGTSAVAVTAAYGVHVSWYELAAQGYTILMGVGAAALMVGRLLIMWRELRGRGKGADP
jgi:hypothetical protein